VVAQDAGGMTSEYVVDGRGERAEHRDHLGAIPLAIHNALSKGNLPIPYRYLADCRWVAVILPISVDAAAGKFI